MSNYIQFELFFTISISHSYRYVINLIKTVELNNLTQENVLNLIYYLLNT